MTSPRRTSGYVYPKNDTGDRPSEGFVYPRIDRRYQSSILSLTYNLSFRTTVESIIEVPLWGTVNATIDWGDGNIQTVTTPGNISHQYATEVGVYRVNITGTVSHFGNESSTVLTSAPCLTSINSWGSVGLTSLAKAVWGCTNLIYVPPNIPYQVTDLSYMFYETSPFNNNINNLNISTWDVSNVLLMTGMFEGSTNFNSELNEWDVSSVTDMSSMFKNCFWFNQPLNNWDVSNVVNMNSMFEGANQFSQSLEMWCVTNITTEPTNFKTNLNWFNLPIWGTCPVSPITRILEVYPQSLIFSGSVMDSWSTIETFFLQNIGTDVLRIESIFVLQWAPWYEIDFQGADALLPLSIGPNQSVSLNVRVRADFPITNSENTLVIVTNSTEQYIYTVPIILNYSSGSLSPHFLPVTTSLLISDKTLVNVPDLSPGNSSTHIITLTNDGDTVLKILGIQTSFWNSNTYPTYTLSWDEERTYNPSDSIDRFQSYLIHDLNPGETATVTVTWSTSVFITQNSQVKFISNSDNNFALTVFGLGIAYPDKVLIAEPSYLIFEAISSTATISKTITLKNEGPTDLTITDITYINEPGVTAVPDYTGLGGSSTTIIQPYTSKTFDVSYTLSVVGEFSGFIVIDNNGLVPEYQLPVLLRNDSIIFTIDTTLIPGDNQITFNTGLSGQRDIVVSWGDGTFEQFYSYAPPYSISHNYATEGIFTVRISGNMNSFVLGSNALVSINEWGYTGITNFQLTSSNLVSVPNLLPTTVTSLENAFYFCTNFNQNLNSWDISNVTTLEGCFAGCENFNQPLDTWNTSNVTNMSIMFTECTVFNQDISSWDVSSVTKMVGMFREAIAFNNPLNTWDVSNVTDMSNMFRGSAPTKTSFNQPLNLWDVGNVNVMTGMFADSEFNQNINNWCVTDIPYEPPQFNANGYLQQSFKPQWGTCQSESNTAAPILTSPMILVLDTNLMTTSQIGFGVGGNVNISIDWGDGSPIQIVQSTPVEGYFHTVVTHTPVIPPETSGIITVQISGTLDRFGFQDTFYYDENNNFTFEERLISLTSVNSFGNLGLKSLNRAFINCRNLINVPTSLPSTVTDLIYCFRNCDIFNSPNISSWNTSNVTNMTETFSGALEFNQPLNNWNVSNVTTMEYMFVAALLFNQPLNNWNVSNVNNMSGMFDSAEAFNQPLNNWNVSNVVDMGYMFVYAISFNQPLDNWNVSKVENFSGMFSQAEMFNQPLSSWNTSSATSMSMMFRGAREFNQPLNNWDVSKVQNFYDMFRGAVNFNQDLNLWDTSSAISMNGMFAAYYGTDADSALQTPWYYQSSFNGSVGDWNVTNVVGMESMFDGAKNFNRSLSGWNTPKLQYAAAMFRNAHSFNQPLNHLNVSLITCGSTWFGSFNNLARMFNWAKSFNQDLSTWCTTGQNGCYNQFLFDANTPSWEKYYQIGEQWFSRLPQWGTCPVVPPPGPPTPPIPTLSVNFTASQTTGTVPLAVTFTNTSTAADSNTQYYWFILNDYNPTLQFYEQSTDAQTKNTSWVYNEVGVYSVTLYARQTFTGPPFNEQTDYETKTNYITVNSPWYSAAPLVEYQGQLLMADQSNSGQIELWGSTDGGLTYNLLNSTSSYASAMTGILSAYQLLAVSNGLRTEYSYNTSTTTSQLRVLSNNDGGVNLYNNTPSIGAIPLVIGALYGNSSILYLVGKIRNQVGEALNLYSSTDGGVTVTSLGQMTVDPSDPNPGTGRSVFQNYLFTRAKLKKFGNRWFLIGSGSAYYTDNSTPLSGWRRCPFGINDSNSNIADVVQVGSRLYVWKINVPVGADILSWAYSDDNGATWIPKDHPSQLQTVESFLSTGYSFGGSLFIWAIGSPTYGTGSGSIIQISSSGTGLTFAKHINSTYWSNGTGSDYTVTTTIGTVVVSANRTNPTARVAYYSYDGYTFVSATQNTSP